MKILTNDGIYVQKNDIAYLTRSETALPASIFMSIFGLTDCAIIDDSNRYEFVKFTDKGEIEFLNGLDWIIDYYEVKDLSQEDLERMFNKIADKRNQLADKFNAMAIETRRKNVEIIDECENLKFMMLNINDINLFKHGKLDLTLPVGVESPTFTIQKIENDIKSAKTDDQEKICKVKKEAGFQKIIRRVFKKKLN